MARSADAPVWDAGALAAYGAIARLDEALELTGFEPASLRPSIAWRQARAKVSDDLASVFRLLALLTPASDPAALGASAGRLDGLARTDEEGGENEEGDLVVVEAASVAAAPEKESTQEDRVVPLTRSIREALDRRIDALTITLEEARRTVPLGQSLPGPSARAFHAAS